MCGIAGWFGARASRSVLDDMLAAIAHRGPDGHGVHLDRTTALGHRRLAVIEPGPAGAQPMSNADGSLTICANGEIYNHRALREALAADGRVFRTASDTEVALALVERDGLAGLDRIRGMFALALWDAANERGHLIRDRHGMKPLYYHAGADGALVFGSEAKAVLRGPEVPAATLDPARLHLLMNLRYVPDGDGLFEGIRQVRPGEILTWRRDRRMTRARLGPWRGEAPQAPLDAVLDDAIAHHLEADVPVAVYLSGGIDSAGIAAIAAGRSAPPPATHTLAVGDDPREAEHAAETARALGLANTRHASIAADRALVDSLVWHLEMPKINAYQGFALARGASATHKVCLSGLGADELFQGYRAHRILRLFERAGRLAPAGLARLAARVLGGVWRRVPGPLWRESERAIEMLGRPGDWPGVYALLRNVWDNPALRRAVYGPRLLDAELPDAFEAVRARWPGGRSGLAAVRAYEWRHKMIDDLLLTEDRTAMAAGVEVRTPFVDPALERHAFAPDASERILGAPPKAALRDALAPRLPRTVLARPKSGFQVDAPSFYHRRLVDSARELLSPERLAAHGLFNPEFVTATLAWTPGKGLRWHYFMLYLMLMTHAWLERFERGDDDRRRSATR